MSQPEYYSPAAPRSSGLGQLTAVGVVLICISSLSLIWGLVDGGFRIPMITGAMKPPEIFGQTPTMANIIAFFILDLVVVLISPIVLFGAIQMLRRKMYTFTRVAAVLAMLPIATHCCCVIGLPMGIWAMVILSRPEVRNAFLQNNQGNEIPPTEFPPG